MLAKGEKGFTLMELIVTIMILCIVTAYAFHAMIRLLSIDELNKEKARALEKLGVISARTQSLVAVGARAEVLEDERLDIVYPYMVFGIACETNRFTQVTNIVAQVRKVKMEMPNGEKRLIPDNTLELVVMSGKKGEGIISTNAMPFLHPDIVTSATRLERKSGGTINQYGIIQLSFDYLIGFDGKTAEVGLAVPVRMRNTYYEGYPDP